ncbi:PQ-loop repeat-containing protein 1 [Grifola frondosa]|uniref:PQ-loop repeat-containing protein 1 n=1 Tax=Grifola frondosa TaxID=5627 RepID=A0A1C7LNV9_GRIFR|nr:PQ-loop repeat-containing protein 1 [Grifola frondosa]
MAVGPPLVYADQAFSIVRKRDATGFSRDVCAILLLANITRCFFCTTGSPLYLYTIQTSNKSRNFGNVLASFFLLAVVYVYTIYRIPCCFHTVPGDSLLDSWSLRHIHLDSGFRRSWFRKYTAYTSLISNYKQRSLYGFRLSTLIGWVGGTHSTYFFLQDSPLQFKVCAIFQLSVDCAIVLQRLYYGNAVPAAALLGDIEQALALAEE